MKKTGETMSGINLLPSFVFNAAGPYIQTAQQHARKYLRNRARIFKRLWSPGIDSKE
jgi:hypothetical protein